MQGCRLTIKTDNYEQVVYLEGMTSLEASKCIRGAVNKGFYYENPDGYVYIGAQVIEASVIEIDDL